MIPLHHHQHHLVHHHHHRWYSQSVLFIFCFFVSLKPFEVDQEKDEKDKECGRSCQHRVLWITDNPKYCNKDRAELMELTQERNKAGQANFGMPRLCSIKHGSTEHEFVMPHFFSSKRSKSKKKLAVPIAFRKLMKRFQSDKGIDQTVDSASKVIFPSVFLLFNIVYWSIYLNKFWRSSRGRTVIINDEVERKLSELPPACLVFMIIPIVVQYQIDSFLALLSVHFPRLYLDYIHMDYGSFIVHEVIGYSPAWVRWPQFRTVRMRT